MSSQPRRRMSLLSRIAIALSLVLAGSLYANAASPRLTDVMPRGVQRGAEHELTFNGNNLGDAQEHLLLRRWRGSAGSQGRR